MSLFTIFKLLYSYKLSSHPILVIVLLLCIYLVSFDCSFSASTRLYNCFDTDYTVSLIQIMDYSLGQRYQNRKERNIQTFSQISNVSAVTAVPLKPLEIACQYHTDEPCNNYCIQPKCFQPLCSQCIEEHLLHHKKYGYSDLAIKSIRGVRKQCVNKLNLLMEELLRRLSQLETPPTPEKIMEVLSTRLEQARNEAHQILQQQFHKISEIMSLKLTESTAVIKSMTEVHRNLEKLIEHLKETYMTIADGRNKDNQVVKECIVKTLTLDARTLLETFESESAVYENRRRKIEFDVLFNPQIIATCIQEAVKIASPASLNSSSASFSRQKYKNSSRVSQSQDQEEELSSRSLPSEVELSAMSKCRIMHFFQTGSNKLHLIQIDNRKRGFQRVVVINEFMVPFFHASLMSQTGEYIFLSGGSVQIDSELKSPLFLKYSVQSQSCKKEFARVRPRSSHSLCQDAIGDIFILGGYGQKDPTNGSTAYQTSVERVNYKTGKVQYQAESNWGGSNISFACRGLILKACDEGIQLYNPKINQWTIADITVKNKAEYLYLRNTGYASLVEGQVLVFGGYDQDHEPRSECSYWRLAVDGGRVRVIMDKLACKLPVPEGFDNSGTVVDQQGFFVLQNIQDEQQPQTCIDSKRRLLRFDLKEGGGEWRVLHINQ